MESRFVEIRKRLKAEAIKPILTLKNLNYRDSILIFSEPRGGSTWILELLSTIPNSATIFEPLHSNYGLFKSSESYTWGNYVDPSAKDTEMFNDFLSILNGKQINSYTVSRSKFSDYVSADFLIIKMIMATSYLPWITEHFSFKKRPIYLMRHPLAVAKSTIENLYKRDKEILVDHQWVPDGKNKELYEKNIDLFSKDRPILYQLVARWCLNNYHAYKQTNDKSIIKVHYEELLIHPNTVLSDIFASWSLPIPDRLFDKINVPSSSDFRNDFRKDKSEQLEKWFKNISNSELEDLEDILKRFGINIYTMMDPMPTSRSKSLMSKTK